MYKEHRETDYLSQHCTMNSLAKQIKVIPYRDAKTCSWKGAHGTGFTSLKSIQFKTRRRMRALRP